MTVVIVLCFLFISLAIFLPILGCFVVEWWESFLEWYGDKVPWIKFWFVDGFNRWGISMHGRVNHFHTKNILDKKDIIDKIEKLIKELIKYNYCKEFLNNPPFSEQEYDNRLRALSKIESQHPDLKRQYSPTQYKGFREDMAIMAYGISNFSGWHVVKRTLWLTKEDAGINDEPIVTILPAQTDYYHPY